MDHPEPISKRPTEIPQCRKGFTLDEARAFVDQVMEVFRSLDDMSDLRSMYETGKQLSRAYFDCHLYRTELAQRLTSCDYPAFASKMMKKLNNMGVFKNDDIWFSSFYFYNTTWNFSDTWPEFATALATAGLPNLLNLNIGHQPYLENLSSKNVYYLIKASLSIIHNIARIPGNIHYFASDPVRQALLHLAQREEEFLRCVSTLCLAYIVTESELNFITDTSCGGIDLLRILFNYLSSARLSEKRRCHGFQVFEFLSALAAFSVHDAVKNNLLTLAVSPTPLSGFTQGIDQSATYLTLLKEFVESGITPNANAISVRECEEAIKIMWNLVFDPSINTTLRSQLSAWLSETIAVASGSPQMTKATLRAMDAVNWQLSVPGSHLKNNNPVECGPILLCFTPLNSVAAGRIADRLKEAGFPLSALQTSTEYIPSTEGGLLGHSNCGCNSSSHTQWLESIEQASILVAFMSDAFRHSPGCRLEVEHFVATGPDSYLKPIVPIFLQPKFKPSGWLVNHINRHPIDFNGKRDPELNYDALFSQLKELHAEAVKRAELAATSITSHHSTDNRRHVVTAGDIGVAGFSNAEAIMNHVNINSVSGNRAPSGFTQNFKQEDLLSSTNHLMLTSKVSTSNIMAPNPLMQIGRPLATNAWRHAIRPEVRTWSTSKVASWLKFRGLNHVSAQLAGGIDGVLLSQLAGLRIWAPDYFTQSLRSELGLGFADSLRFLEALDELAPDDEENKKLDDGVDGRSRLGSLEGSASRA